MSKYKVINPFYDVIHHVNYFVDEAYPKEGMKVDIDRLEELSTKKNGIGKALIEEIKVDEPEKDIDDSKEEDDEVQEDKEEVENKKGKKDIKKPKGK